MDGAVVAWIVTVLVLLVLAAALVVVLRRGRAGGAVSPIDRPRPGADEPPAP